MTSFIQSRNHFIELLTLCSSMVYKECSFFYKIWSENERNEINWFSKEIPFEVCFFRLTNNLQFYNIPIWIGF